MSTRSMYDSLAQYPLYRRLVDAVLEEEIDRIDPEDFEDYARPAAYVDDYVNLDPASVEAVLSRLSDDQYVAFVKWCPLRLEVDYENSVETDDADLAAVLDDASDDLEDTRRWLSTKGPDISAEDWAILGTLWCR